MRPAPCKANWSSGISSHWMKPPRTSSETTPWTWRRPPGNSSNFEPVNDEPDGSCSCGASGWPRPTSPKAVTGNLGVRLRRIIEINGFDEAYMDWGFEDDDFTRRLHAAKSRPVLAHATALVFHQWHPTLKQADWTESDSAQRFRASTPMRCEHGIEHPVPQHDISSSRLID